MDTGLLKGFAAGARVDLIKEVGARLDVVLASGSVARAEAPGSVAALERAVGRDGREAVVDRVAYTWFNRIIALRFMDANGYTGVGVVSPEPGKLSGQPQVLSDAKGGDFDADVVSAKTQATVSALLNDTRPSTDPQGEAYGLLLEAYCRFWNRAMPFMFEREGDYTELLTPTALLATDSVRDRAVRTLTDEVCGEVEVIGWLYQFYISERKDEVFAGFKKNKKAGAAEIPAATQLFTPHWIVRYLVENSLGRLWLLNHPESQLAEQMDYYIAPVDEETDFLRVSSPEELKVIDPAVGSGHMLTYAFDLLYAIYEEQAYSPSEIPSKILEHNLYGAEIDPRAGALAAFALTMKAAKKRKLFLKNPVQPHVCVLENVRFEQADLDYLWSLTSGSVVRSDADGFWNAFEHADTLGSLIQPNEALIPVLMPVVEQLETTGNLLATPARRVLDQAEQLSTRYHVVVANPPYMGSKNMVPLLADYLATHFDDAKSDLYAAFIAKCHDLARRGFIAMITMQSWTFQTTFKSFRQSLIAANPLVGMMGLGVGAFDSLGGEVVNTCAFVTSRMGSHSTVGAFYRMKQRGEAAMDAEFRLARANGDLSRFFSSEFESFPNSVIAYWLSPAQASLLSHDPSLSSVADARVGLQTGDNDRFLRGWWEVSFTATQMGQRRGGVARWLPYSKGGPFRKWFGNLELVIDWSNDGSLIKTNRDSSGKLRARPQNQAYYGRPAIEWSDIGQPILGARLREAGVMFDVVSMSVFSRDDDDESELMAYLAYLNSTVADTFINAVAPGMHANTGYVSLLPWRDPARFPAVSDRARACVEIAQRNWRRRETTAEFGRLDLVDGPAGFRLADIARGIIDAIASDASSMARAETENNADFLRLFGIDDEMTPDVGAADVTLDRPSGPSLASDLVSYAIGCMFGRYSLDVPGLVLANQGDSLQEYLARVPDPSFMPDADGVIPVVDGEWFEDDVVAKFRQFLRVAFGEEHFEENLKFVIDSLGVKDLRDYFVKSFYKDHVQRYKKRPIYWMFSSPKGSFNALVYLHRYNPSTVSTVLNEYLREFIKKLEVSLEQQERMVVSGANAREVAVAQKEAERLRKVLFELGDYERDLYDLASHQVDLDLDDGVLVNYQKFGAALKDIGLKKGGDNA
ncbi:BREX-1 system adenine-specific DNA-methyltransferase PglX [Microbacterium sp.]|uniref:BREX-1 system adenine-specific DNA-methyltransferase PglX n=1 Tax=Microbacterium sp. TaxID=51671 RepID=UPI003A925BBC